MCYVYVYVCSHLFVYVCVTYVCMYVLPMCVCMQLFICVGMCHVCVYVCSYLFVYICVTYICLHHSSTLLFDHYTK